MFSRKKEKQRDPATWEHTREINEVYKDCNSLCTHSGYANVDTQGELVFQTWPEKNKEAFNDLRKRANEVRKNYAAAQVIDMERPENVGFLEDFKKQGMHWYADIAYWPGSVKDKEIQRTFEGIQHIFRLSEVKESFEKQLICYIETREIFEDHVDQVKSLVNTMIGSDPTEVPIKIKTKIKELFEEGLKWALKVARTYNLLSNWGMKMIPHMQGNYSWYSFKQGETIVPREPWHQYVDIKEAEDIFRQFDKLKEAGHLSEKLGVIQDAGEIDAFTELLEPKHRLNEDGQVIYFPKLWDREMKEVEEGEINVTLSPAEEDLILLQGKTPEPVLESGGNDKEKLKEFKTKLAGNEELDQSRYYDAKGRITPPLASSAKKKLTKIKRKGPKIESSDDSEGSDEFNMSSVSSGSVNTNCSPEQLKKKAEKRILKVQKALRMGGLNEEALKTMKYDTKSVARKIDLYGDADDEDLNVLLDKMENLVLKIDQKIEDKKMLDRKQRQLPRGKMMTWDGGVESYLDFKRQMMDMLIYDSESLNLSSLKAQIVGKEKNYIMDLLHNVDSKEEAFEVLNTHFGDIRTVLPRLRVKLDKLPSFPEKEEIENSNIQSILNYYKTARNHGMHESAINYDFIQFYSEKLSKINKKILIKNKVDECQEFIQMIKEFQRTNLQFLHTNQSQTSSKTYHNVTKTEEFERGHGRGQNKYSPRNQTGGANGEQRNRNPTSEYNRGYNGNRNGARGPIKCLICDEPHLSYSCPLLTEEKDMTKIRNC